ncbi:MAG: serine/threonine protein kinase [bacterium]|nr:serine/threonine protein kinase [bacterium]
MKGADLKARHGHQAIPQGDDTQTVSARPGATPARADVAADGIHSRGAVFGRYRVLSLLGQGGMGNIYAAYDPELDRKVALKVLRQEALGRKKGEAAQLRLIREARAIAKLNHPNAVRVYDVGTVGDQVFVAMELIEGLTLAQWLEIEPRPWREILRIFLEAGKGLGAAHAAGLVHRDFKPSNVMVTLDGQVLVLDFGLARAPMATETPDSEEEESPRSPAMNTPTTLTGEASGTPAYMAPEQFRGTGADARADQFSFCVALYKALHGEPPFEGDTLPELRRAIEKGEVREPSAKTRVPSWVRRALLRGLDADPEARYVDLKDLLAVLEHDPLARRRQWLGAAALLLGLVAALVTGLQCSANKRSLLCRGAERKLAGVWDAGRKDVLRQTFLTSGLAHAESTWTRIEDRLDGYAEAWVTTHTEACEATRLRGEQSAEMLDLQMACLDKRLRELRITTDLLAGADQQIIRNAIPMASNLPAIDACVDREALASAPHRDPETEAQADQIRERLFKIKALDLAGKYAEGLALVQEATDIAESLSDQPLLADDLKQVEAWLAEHPGTP